MFGFRNDYAIIKDKKGKILASGKIKGRKVLSGDLIFDHVSVDGNFFFKLDSGNFDFEFTDNAVEEKPFDGSLVYFNWFDCDEHVDADIFFDHDKKELDKEVELLVECLNRLDGIETVCSCSGHDEIPLFVDFTFTKVLPVQILENLITHEFLGKFNLLFDVGRYRVDDMVVLSLKTIEIGKPAYSVAEELALKLYEITSN